jgi:hypothetical protein
MMFYIYCLRSGPYIHPHKGGVGVLIRQPSADKPYSRPSLWLHIVHENGLADQRI